MIKGYKIKVKGIDGVTYEVLPESIKINEVRLDDFLEDYNELKQKVEIIDNDQVVYYSETNKKIEAVNRKLVELELFKLD